MGRSRWVGSLGDDSAREFPLAPKSPRKRERSSPERAGLCPHFLLPCHPERSVTESKNPVALPKTIAGCSTGSLRLRYTPLRMTAGGSPGSFRPSPPAGPASSSWSTARASASVAGGFWMTSAG